MPVRTRMFSDRGKQRSSYGRILTIVAPILAVLCIIGVIALQMMHLAPARASSANSSTTFPTARPALLQRSHLNGPANSQQRVSLSIGLRVHNQAALTQYVQDISRPGSVNYHRFLTAAQYQGAFSPSRATYDALSKYLQGSGFTITHTYSHRLMISFSGTIAQVEQAFSVKLSNYTAPDGRSFYANNTDPQLPAWLAGEVQSISGLNNATRYGRPPVRSHAVSRVTPHATTCLGTDPKNAYLTSDQVTTAYNLKDMYRAGFQGEGQSVALFELATFSQSDLATYASCYGNSHTPVQTVTVGSAPVASDAGITEVELDAELVLSTAPQLGRLVIYEAGNNSADYLAEWAQIVQDAVPVVSTSWGICEQLADPGLVSQENILFTAAAAQGQSVFAASGDSGSAGCAFDDPGTNPTTLKPGDPLAQLSAGDPAAQPFVTAVGGTKLAITSTSAYNGEATWNNAPDSSKSYIGGASGGGISKYWTAPSWQSGVKNGSSSAAPCNAAANAFCREVPDVSLHADPNNGYLIYCTVVAAGCSSTQPWYSFGGTSATAPMWAAMMALTNEMSLKQGGFNLGFVNPLLYQVASNPTSYAASFNDVNTGNNDYNNLNKGVYGAAAGYDMATGLGSYKAFGLATSLVKSATQVRTSPASPIWYFAEGSVGNGFQEYITLQNPSVSQSATVSVTYLFQGNKAPIIVSHPVAASSRYTVDVNKDLGVKVTDPQQAISAIVQVAKGDPGIVAERPMYFSFNGIKSGTDVMGTTAPQTSYYFPSVDTSNKGRTYYSYLTMLNPGNTQATATITYYTGSCGQSNSPVCPTEKVVIDPSHRATASPTDAGVNLHQQTSVMITSDRAIVVERPTYFSDTIPTAGGLTTGAASEIGASAPGKDWLFAEGYTGNGFQEYLVLANFGSTATTATVTLEYDNGHKQAVKVSVPALGHVYYDVNKVNAAPVGICDVSPCQTTNTASAEVTSVANIVVDRLMYFHYGAGKLSGATEAVGEPGPASNSVYSFAEGYTKGSFQEYLTLQNPTTVDEVVAVTLFVGTYVLQQQELVKAQSRKTININQLVVPVAQGYTNPPAGVDPYSVSLTVQALGSGAKIVAERPMYFNYYGDQGGTNVFGYTAPK